ncbi:hypothetical protein F4780DRAFT_59220 [Xylariomycetidae sp. FL0641]|nr:hypothetical protein F4780DRAFT_59220 [Xylariomycetidae sp. FL0641]
MHGSSVASSPTADRSESSSVYSQDSHASDSFLLPRKPPQPPSATELTAPDSSALRKSPTVSAGARDPSSPGLSTPPRSPELLTNVSSISSPEPFMHPRSPPPVATSPALPSPGRFVGHRRKPSDLTSSLGTKATALEDFMEPRNPPDRRQARHARNLSDTLAEYGQAGRAKTRENLTRAREKVTDLVRDAKSPRSRFGSLSHRRSPSTQSCDSDSAKSSTPPSSFKFASLNRYLSAGDSAKAAETGERDGDTDSTRHVGRMRSLSRSHPAGRRPSSISSIDVQSLKARVRHSGRTESGAYEESDVGSSDARRSVENEERARKSEEQERKKVDKVKDKLRGRPRQKDPLLQWFVDHSGGTLREKGISSFAA